MKHHKEIDNINLVSVIVPLYNKAAWVKRCVESICKQSYTNIEILIINDGSTDRSLEIVSSINDVRIKIFNKSNTGLSSTRNYGIQQSKGSYIAFIDADDEWKIKYLELMLKGFQKSNDVVLVCSDLVETYKDNKSAVKRRKLPFTIDDNIIHYHLIENYLETLKNGYFILSGSSVVIKKSIFEKDSLLFYTEAQPAEDVNYWIRLNHLGVFIFCDYIGVYYHRIDQNSIMNSIGKQVKLIPPFFYKIDISKYNTKEIQDIKLFLTKEYYKKAYQNRGLSFRKEELLYYFDNGIKVGIVSVSTYLIIRFLPKFLLTIIKKIKTVWN